MKFGKRILACMLASLFSVATAQGTIPVSAEENYYAEIFVSADGNDKTADGTEAKPYKTIEAARKKVQTIQKSSAYTGGDIAVTFGGGTYRVGTVGFGASESGSEKGRVVYRSKSGEQARFVNSVQLNVSDFEPLEDSSVLKRLPLSAQDKVYVIDLTDYLTDTAYIEYPYIKNMGSANLGKRGTTRFFLNDKPQTISRWPNVGYKDLLLSDGSSSVVSSGSSGEDIVLAFEETNPLRWSTASDMVIRGYMMNVYCGASYDVKSIDSENKQITLDNIYGKGLNTSTGSKRRWYAENLLEEIDIPGEYYIDVENSKLYWYPPYELSEDDLPELVCGIGNGGNNMFQLNKASYISFENLTFEQAAYKAISLVESSHISIEGCTIGYTHSNGVQISKGCRDISVKNCVIYNTAASGVYAVLDLDNEAFKTMENTGIVIENNHIYKSGENATYPWPAIHSDGIGDSVRNNTVHQTPICGIEFASANGTFAYNEVYKAVYDGADSGAMHIGGDWRRYGINVEYNYIHDVGTKEAAESYTDMPFAGIYWDEVHSGTVQKNNFIVLDPTIKTHGLFMNGGRDHTAENNVIVGAQTAFCNPNTHSSYYLLSPESTLSLHPTHSGLERTYKTFLELYNDADYKTSKHYELFGAKMNELAGDIEEYQMFSAKNLTFDRNVVFGSENETYFKQNNPITMSLQRRFYTTDKDFTLKTVDYTSTVTVDNYIGSEYSEEDIFVNPATGDYRVSENGKSILNITDDEFKLDETFDMGSIGCSNDISFDDDFKMLYPIGGETTYNGKSVTLVWESALFADEYEYTVYDKAGNVAANGATMYTNAEVSGLLPDSEYTWTVTAKYTSAISSVENGGVKTLKSSNSNGSFKTSPYAMTAQKASYDDTKKEICLTVNNIGEEKQAMLITAVYEENGKKFKDCKTQTVTVKAGLSDISAEVGSETNDFMNGSAVVYLWTADSKFEPLLGRKIYVK